MNQNYINHIVFVVDKSGSMASLSNEVVKVFDSQIEHLAVRSKELDQETRVSVYLFNEKTECIIYDKDVLRLPSLKKFYRADGGTALIDATLKALDDLEKSPQLYGEHSYLVYVATDGQENRSGNSSNDLRNKLKKLPDNWTLATLVPDQNGVFEAKNFGFPAENIQVWSTTTKGVKEVGEVIRKATDNFMVARSSGLKGTKSLFNIDLSNLSSKKIKTALQELNTIDYDLFPVHKESPIKEYVESWTKEDYRKGSAYYLLTKPETVQSYKQVCIQNKINGKVYSGTNARKMLNLPDFEVKVSPANYGDYDLFIQSSSTNRKLMKGTKLLVLK